jgi:hypothetical protein
MGVRAEEANSAFSGDAAQARCLQRRDLGSGALRLPLAATTARSLRPDQIVGLFKERMQIEDNFRDMELYAG